VFFNSIFILIDFVVLFVILYIPGISRVFYTYTSLTPASNDYLPGWSGFVSEINSGRPFELSMRNGGTSVGGLQPYGQHSVAILVKTGYILPVTIRHFFLEYASSIIGTEIVYYPEINRSLWMTGGCSKNRKDEVRPRSNAAEPLSRP
jgi:hypothetical protein